MRASVGLGAGVYIIAPDGRLLLVEQERDGRAMWATFGGGVHAGESVEAAAIREAHEESGLRVRLVRVIAIDQIWSRDLDSIVFTFLAEPDGWPQPIALPDRDGSTRFLRAQWFARDELATIANMYDDELCRVCWPPEITSPYMRTLRWH